MRGLAQLYIRTVLILSGLRLTGRIQDREIAVITVFADGVTLPVALHRLLDPRADVETRRAAGFLLLFTATLVPVAFSAPSEAATLATIRLGLSWVTPAGLRFTYFLLLALGRSIPRITGIVTPVAGVVTAWIPGSLSITGRLTVP